MNEIRIGTSSILASAPNQAKKPTLDLALLDLPIFLSLHLSCASMTSGALYAGEPGMVYARFKRPFGRILASPTSASLARLLASNKMLEGLMSEWTASLLCR